MASADENRVVLDLYRDLCTMTEDEVSGVWTGVRLAAIEKIRPGYFDSVIRGHNPIYFLARLIWFDNAPDLLYEPFHRDRICKQMLEYYLAEDTGDLHGMVLLAQRDSFKTTFAHGVFPHFISFRGKHVHKRDERILLMHHKEEIACENLTILKQKSWQSEPLKMVWPEFKATEDWDTRRGFNWPCKEEARQKENSVAASGLTARQAGRHYDWILPDDIVNEEHRFSKRLRDEAKFRFSATRALMDTKRGKALITGTFYHNRDLYALLQKSENYKFVIIPAGGDHSLNNAPLSFPTRHSQTFLDKKKREFESTGDGVFYYLQYQLELKSATNVSTDAEWLRYIDEKDIPREGDSCFTVITIDPAIKGMKNQGEGDSHAIAVVRIQRRGSIVNRYLCDLVVSNELTQQASDDELFRLMKKWSCMNVAPEEHGSHAYRTHLRDEANKRGQYINIIDLKSKQIGKDRRIVLLIGTAEAGCLFVSRGCDNLEVFVDQFADYDPNMDHDDAIDAVAYSCDENILDRYASPEFNEDASDDYAIYVPPPRRRTRHCTV